MNRRDFLQLAAGTAALPQRATDESGIPVEFWEALQREKLTSENAPVPT